MKKRKKSKTLQALRIRPSGPALTSHIVLNGTNAEALSEEGQAIHVVDATHKEILFQRQVPEAIRRDGHDLLVLIHLGD